MCHLYSCRLYCNQPCLCNHAHAQQADSLNHAPACATAAASHADHQPNKYPLSMTMSSPSSQRGVSPCSHSVRTMHWHQHAAAAETDPVCVPCTWPAPLIGQLWLTRQSQPAPWHHGRAGQASTQTPTHMADMQVCTTHNTDRHNRDSYDLRLGDVWVIRRSGAGCVSAGEGDSYSTSKAGQDAAGLL